MRAVGKLLNSSGAEFVGGIRGGSAGLEGDRDHADMGESIGETDRSEGDSVGNSVGNLLGIAVAIVADGMMITGTSDLATPIGLTTGGGCGCIGAA